MTDRGAMSIPEAAKWLGISETHARLLARTGRIPAMRLGSRWIVPVKALEEFLSPVTYMSPNRPATPRES